MPAPRPVALALAAALAGCAAHVPLPPAPPPAAPIAERLGYYSQYRPSATTGLAQFSLNGFGGYSTLRGSVDRLVLANGLTVADPEDLLQMVGPDSALAEPARRAARAQSIASAVTWGGFAASVLGAVVMLSSLGSVDAYDGLGVPFWAGFGVGLAGSIASGVGRWALAPAAAAEREAVFVALDGALRARMSLCAREGLVVDCHAGPAPAPASPLPSPWAAPPPLPPPPPAGVSIHAR